MNPNQLEQDLSKACAMFRSVLLLRAQNHWNLPKTSGM